MKTASEIQIEALADAYDERCCDLEACRTMVDNIIMMCEQDHNKEAIANYAKHSLTDIIGMIEERDA